MTPYKSVGTAYLWWLFTGAFGGHQFYMGKTGRAIAYLFTLGYLTIGVWIDLFTMRRQVRKINEGISRNGVSNDYPGAAYYDDNYGRHAA